METGMAHAGCPSAPGQVIVGSPSADDMTSRRGADGAEASLDVFDSGDLSAGSSDNASS